MAGISKSFDLLQKLLLDIKHHRNMLDIFKHIMLVVKFWFDCMKMLVLATCW